MQWAFGMRFHATGGGVRLARRMVTAAAREARGDERAIADLETAVGEAAANVYLHAYPRRTGTIEVELAFDGSTLQVEVRDHGRPPAAGLSIPRGLPPPGAGRGLYLIGQLVDEVRLIFPYRNGRGTAVVMRKRLR